MARSSHPMLGFLGFFLVIFSLSSQNMLLSLLFSSPRVFLEPWSARMWVSFPSIMKSLSFGSYSHAHEGPRETGHGGRGGRDERQRRKSRIQRWRLWLGGVPAPGVIGNPELSLLPPILLPGKSLQQLPPATARSG